MGVPSAPRILSVDHLDNGAMINFVDDKSAFFSAALLYFVLPQARMMPTTEVPEGLSQPGQISRPLGKNVIFKSNRNRRDRPCYPRSNRTTKYGVCFLKSGNIVPQRILSIA